MKTHHFLVTVKTDQNKRAAKTAILRAFALRQPDGCEFHTKEYRKPTTFAALSNPMLVPHGYVFGP